MGVGDSKDMNEQEETQCYGELSQRGLQRSRPRWWNRKKAKAVICVAISVPWAWGLTRALLDHAGLDLTLTRFDLYVVTLGFPCLAVAFAADHIFERKQRSWIFEIIVAVLALLLFLGTILGM